jgi:putative transposase
MDLAVSTYYYKPKKDPNLKLKSDSDIRAKIEEIHLTLPGYGWRRIRREFLKMGLHVNHKRIKRIMREFGLYSVLKRQFKIKTTNSNHPFKVYKNLLLGKKVTGINQVWAADITYIRLEMEFIYLAAIIDIYSRKIVGWAISRSIDHKLSLKALEVAIHLRKPKPGCIHHSDRGMQYCSDVYIKHLKNAGFKISMCSIGSPKENAFIESFFKTLKHEEILLNEYSTYEKVLERLPNFIEDVYNKKRMHSALEYESPSEFEKKLKRMKKSTRPVQKLVEYFL